jgi:lipid-A-disaccharide synthase
LTGERVHRVFLVAGEASGDHLGADLIGSLRKHRPDLRFSGVGGPAMARMGLASLFPMADINVMGVLPVIRSLPTLLARIKAAAAAILADPPDVLVLIDAPDFTHRVARRVRKARPDIPIIDYVSPTVWAWRPGRARQMRAYVDHVLALLPFEPAAHARLGGPLCSYVGHPLLARLDQLRPGAAEQVVRDGKPPVLLVLPGSRRSEIQHLMPVFGETVAEAAALFPGARFVLPAVDHVRPAIEAALTHWSVRPEVVGGEAAKLAAFRQARAALAASGTVTLELALSGVPAVVAYKGSGLEAFIARRLVTVASVVLPNIILDEVVVPELLQEACTPERLLAAWALLIEDTEARKLHLAALARVAKRMQLAEASPGAKAAEIVLRYADGAKEKGA